MKRGQAWPGGGGVATRGRAWPLQRKTSPNATSERVAFFPSVLATVRLWPVPGAMAPSSTPHQQGACAAPHAGSTAALHDWPVRARLSLTVAFGAA